MRQACVRLEDRGIFGQCEWPWPTTSYLMFICVLLKNSSFFMSLLKDTSDSLSLRPPVQFPVPIYTGLTVSPIGMWRKSEAGNDQNVSFDAST